MGALGRTRTCNLLIRSQMLYPLSYERALQIIPAAGGGNHAGEGRGQVRE